MNVYLIFYNVDVWNKQNQGNVPVYISVVFAGSLLTPRYMCKMWKEATIPGTQFAAMIIHP